MPNQDDISRNEASTRRELAREAVSRRSMLRGAAMAGAGGVAASAFAGLAGAAPALAAQGRANGPAAPEATAPGDQIIVHIADIRSGRLDVLRGTSQTELHDPDLVARLVRASRS
jgi:hypothetical protein